MNSIPQKTLVTSNEVAQRVEFLDGVRGWASFAVLLYHSMICFLALSTPFLIFDSVRFEADLLSHNYFDILVGVVLTFISDGHLAVLIFFVLSGYALSLGHLNLARRKLALATVSRYFRLMIPILVTSLIAYILLKLNLMFNLDVATSAEKFSGWLGKFYKFDASIFDAVKFSLYNVFFHYETDRNYNSSLWTMPIEFLCSIMIYSYLGIFRVTEKVHWRIAIILMITLFAIKPLFACFLIGYLIAEFNKKYGANYLINILGEKNTEFFLILTFFLTALVSTFFRADEHVDCLFASIIVITISLSKIMQSFFTNGLSTYLGRISFPLYLIQISIICSWSSYLYLKIPELGIDIISASIINLFLTILLCLLLATALLPIEKLSVTYSKKIANLLLN